MLSGFPRAGWQARNTRDARRKLGSRLPEGYGQPAFVRLMLVVPASVQLAIARMYPRPTAPPPPLPPLALLLPATGAVVPVPPFPPAGPPAPVPPLPPFA